MEGHWHALSETLQNIAKIASILTKTGISIRFLNSEHDENGEFDNLKHVKDVKERLKGVKCRRGSKIGTALKDKVVEPKIIRKAKSQELHKPVIVMVITDGRVSAL